ncbi:NAD(P)-dependent alcohol dehydrogenase [Mycetocola sp. 2940]|uniref:NAD(P)-dependent alcohol dehydrogenase n=1 Tax=Mycetocola sp. 2940 TaxID=3156452 RepID=UPI003399529E
MQAVTSRRYGPPDSVRIEDIPTPVPENDEILVRNYASVVTTALAEARRGSVVARPYFGVTRPKWPVLGTNFAGVVSAIGSSVTRFRIGDRVTGVNTAEFGAHAQYVIVQQDGVLTSTPSNLTDAESAAVFDGSVTALPFLRDRAALQPGQSVLINGAAGSVGTAAVQIAKHYGCHVTAVCSAGNAALVRSLGADAVIDYAATDFTAARDRYDLIFDTVGTSSFGRSRETLTRDGLFLTTVPSLAILARMALSRLSRKKAGIVFTGLEKPAVRTTNLAWLGELAEAGALVPVIHRAYPMEQAAEAYALVETGHKSGSAILTFDD